LSAVLAALGLQDFGQKVGSARNDPWIYDLEGV